MKRGQIGAHPLKSTASITLRGSSPPRPETFTVEILGGSHISRFQVPQNHRYGKHIDTHTSTRCGDRPREDLGIRRSKYGARLPNALRTGCGYACRELF